MERGRRSPGVCLSRSGNATADDCCHYSVYWLLQFDGGRDGKGWEKGEMKLRGINNDDTAASDGGKIDTKGIGNHSQPTLSALFYFYNDCNDDKQCILRDLTAC
jgi:hypothetical protein